MPFTIQEFDNIQNSALDVYLNKGTVFKQNVQNKPMSKAFEDNSGTFPTGGRGNVSMAVKGGQGGGALQGYSTDDQVGYYNPASQKRVNFSWKEMHIGIAMTHSELKADGITVTENGADQRTSEKDGREIAALANILDEKLDDFAEDYAVSWDGFIHGDGTSDSKSIAGIRAFILDSPGAGITGGLGRGVNTWWRNRAATAANAAAGGMGAITSSTANGGALLQFLQNERRQLDRFAQGGTKRMSFAGSAFINAMETELRANGNYTLTGWNGGGAKGAATADMPDVSWDGKGFIYDPKLDDLGYSKRMYTIDMKRIRVLYMVGERMKKANPARPYDRYVMYKAITTTAVMVCQQLNTSGVYDIN